MPERFAAGDRTATTGASKVRFPWETGGETVVFETPEQTRLEYRIAPFGTRIAAALLDELVITGITVVVIAAGVLVLLLLGTELGEDSAVLGTAIAGLVVFRFLATVFYFTWGEVRGEGQTWGKRRLGIRTILATGRGVTLGAAIVRNLARVADDFPLMWIVPVLTTGTRRMGDLLAGTLVVSVSGAGLAAAAVSPSGPAAGLRDRRFFFDREQIGKLYADDLNLLEHVEARLHKLTAARRRELVLEIARRYAARLDISRDVEAVARIEEDPGRFLRELMIVLRERFEGQAY